MSTASISYKSLGDASSEAKAVAKKLDKYADSLYSNVYKKLNKYDGSWSDNLSTAKSTTNSKIQSLRTEQSEYESYASSLTGLRDECKRVDKAVRSNVSSLTASFKAAHGIRNSKVENAINYLFTSLNNKTVAGRWIGGKQDEFKSGVSYLKDSIKEWYNYEGGKELLKGVLVGLLEVAIGVLAIVGAILSGGALIVIIAGVVGGIIAVANGVANILNEQKAYSATQRNDPATGRRRSDINTWQDYLRSSYAFGDDGEHYEYSKWRNGLALGIDIVNLACTVVTLVSSAGKLLKNGFKWATGSTADLKDIKIKQIFSKDAIGAFRGKFANIKEAFNARGWSAAKDIATNMCKDFGRNLKNEYWNFEKLNGDFDLKGAVSSVKNMLSVTKDLVSDGFTVKNVFKIGVFNVAFPGLTAFTVEGSDVTAISTNEEGQMFFDFTENITVNNIYGVVENTFKLITSGYDELTSEDMIANNVLDKLSSMSELNISIPNIDVPNIDMPITRAA